MDIRINLSQKQTLTPQMIQSMKILQMNSMELKNYIENIALENPMIDSVKSEEYYLEDERRIDIQRKLDWLESTDQQNSVYYKDEREESAQEESWRDIRDSGEDLSDFLQSQLLLHKYTRQEKKIIDYLIESLNSSGYCMDDMQEIATFFSTEKETVEKLLSDIQKLDPAGVGARNLQECLLIQLHKKQNYSVVTESIIRNYLELVAKNHLKEIAAKLKITIDEVKESCEEIRSFNPKPGNCYNDRSHFYYVSPDVVVVKFEGHFDILVNDYQYPKLQINPYYQELGKTTQDKEVKDYLRDKIGQVENIISSIDYRLSTLSKVAYVLVEKQMDFFWYGPGHRHPLRLSDIAQEVGLHESTVSRALQNKYLQCSWGVYPLNYFLTAAAVQSANAAKEQTQEQIMEVIRKIIEEEDKEKPLSDQRICEKLLEKNIKISRRTINKYRQLLGIPDKGGRKRY